MSSYLVKTLGCKANLADSQLVEKALQEKGWRPGLDDSPVELCIINSCTVTDEADRQSRKWAARLAKDHPNAKILITGCGAEVDPEGMARSQGVDWVVGNQNKDQMVELILDSASKLSSDILNQSVLGTTKTYKELLSKHPIDREWPAIVDSFQPPPVHLEGHSDKTRSFLKIQEGCDSFCTYCIIPYGRGPSRSLPVSESVAQVKQLVEQGIREVVLTGTNIGEYGSEAGSVPRLGELIGVILKETSLERLRVSSLDPTEITQEILDLMGLDARFCPHFHVSLQSPSSKILRLMKRRYSYEHVKECLEKIAELSSHLPVNSRGERMIGGVFVGMDVITGFPGETDEDFQWTVNALSTLPWTRLHVFPYSERKGTPAVRLPGSVPQRVRVERTRILNRLSMERLQAHYRGVLNELYPCSGSLSSVLVEKSSEGRWQAGFTPNYLRVLWSGASSSRNELISVQPRELMIDSNGNDVALVAERA
jgi:threonylcarbamoyladenosine tRNA methylthiotransferase MtaB